MAERFEFSIGNDLTANDLTALTADDLKVDNSAAEVSTGKSDFVFIEANEPGSAKRKHAMAQVRKHAMASYLEAESAKSKSTQRPSKIGDKDQEVVQDVRSRTEALRVFREMRRRPSITEDGRTKDGQSMALATLKSAILKTEQHLNHFPMNTPVPMRVASSPEEVADLAKLRSQVMQGARREKPASSYEPGTQALIHHMPTDGNPSQRFLALLNDEGETKPLHLEQKTMRIVKAMYDYHPQTRDGEMILQEGDHIQVQDTNPSGWWYGRNMATSQEGWFPSNHIMEGDGTNIVEQYLAGHENISLHDVFIAARDVDMKTAVALLRHIEDELNRLNSHIREQPNDYELSRKEYDLLHVLPARYWAVEPVSRALQRYIEKSQSESGRSGMKKVLPSLPLITQSDDDSEADDKKSVATPSLASLDSEETTESEKSVATLKADPEGVFKASSLGKDSFNDFKMMLQNSGRPDSQQSTVGEADSTTFKQAFKDRHGLADFESATQQPGGWDPFSGSLVQHPQSIPGAFEQDREGQQLESPSTTGMFSKKPRESHDMADVPAPVQDVAPDELSTIYGAVEARRKWEIEFIKKKLADNETVDLPVCRVERVSSSNNTFRFGLKRGKLLYLFKYPTYDVEREKHRNIITRARAIKNALEQANYRLIPWDFKKAKPPDFWEGHSIGTMEEEDDDFYGLKETAKKENKRNNESASADDDEPRSESDREDTDDSDSDIEIITDKSVGSPKPLSVPKEPKSMDIDAPPKQTKAPLPQAPTSIVDTGEDRFSRDYQFFQFTPEADVNGKGVALFDFERENNNELPLVEGQIIMVSYRHGQGWLVAQDPKTGESGLVPEEYVRLLRDIDGGLNEFLENKNRAEKASLPTPRSSRSTSPALSPSPTNLKQGHSNQMTQAARGNFDHDLTTARSVTSILSGRDRTALEIGNESDTSDTTEADVDINAAPKPPIADSGHAQVVLSQDKHSRRGLKNETLVLRPEVPPRKGWSSKSYRSAASATTSIGSDTDDTDIAEILEDTTRNRKARNLWRKPNADIFTLEEESDGEMPGQLSDGLQEFDLEGKDPPEQQSDASSTEDLEPHMVSEELKLSIDNWKDVRSQLPEDWRWDVDFHTTHKNIGDDRGCWTCTPTDEDPKYFPLSIAGAPVIIPVDYRWPPLAGVNPPPDPRPSTPIDCMAAIPLDVVRDIFLTFEGCMGFYLLLNGMLQLIVPGEFDTAWASSHLPHKYGGLRVSYITQSMSPTMFPSKTETMGSKSSQMTQSSQSSSISSLLNQFKHSTASSSLPLRLNDFIEARVKSSLKKERFSGRIGLKVSKEGDAYLVMPTHVVTEAILAKSNRSSLFGRRKEPSQQLEGDWNDHVELWAGNERIGSVERSFDPEAEIYPDGFRHDVTLVKPANIAVVRNIQSPVPNLGWLSRESWNGLRQQPSSLKLLGETEDHRKAKTLKVNRPSEVLIVGEGIFINQNASPKPTRDHDMSVWRDLVSRCVLYRVSPDFDPPTGYSGIALYTNGLREDGTTGPGVVGFQSFVQRSGHVQSFEMEGNALEKRLKLGRVAFYGAFQAPEELKQFEIL